MADPRNRKKAKPKPPAEPPAAPHVPPPRQRTAGPLLSVSLKAAIAASIIVGVVYAVVRLGESAGLQVAPRDRYTVHFTDLVVEPPPGLTPQMMELEAGDVLFFNGSVIHGSTPNTSADRFRRSLIFHYVPASTVEMSAKRRAWRGLMVHRW